MQVFSSPFPSNKPACSSFLRTAPGVFTAWGSIQYPFSCTMHSSGFSAVTRALQHLRPLLLSTALHDLLVPAAPETSEYSGRSAEMVNRSKYCAFHKHGSPRKASQSRARSMTISVILNRQSSHSSLHVIHTLCKTSKQPHSSTSAQRCVAAIESTAD